MSDLTEKWKKGELEDREYYIKSNKGDTYIDICADGNFMFTNYRSIEEVLAPVPSYAEWKSVCDDCNSMQETIFSQDSIYRENENLLEEIEKIDEENTKLKELLEKASYYLISYKNNDTLPERAFYEEEVSEFLEKIDEVLK